METEAVLFEGRGSGAIGTNPIFCFRGSYPFAKIKLYQDRIVFSLWPVPKAAIALENLESFSFIGSWLFGTKISFKHKEPAVPTYVSFSGLEVKKMVDLLENMGVQQTTSDGFLKLVIWSRRFFGGIIVVLLILVVIANIS